MAALVTQAARRSDCVDYREILPELLAQIAEVAGLKAALALRRRLGGTLVHVARRPKAGSLLVETVGIEAARKIAGLFVADETIEIPMGAATQRALIVYLLTTGLKVQEIARLVGCHAETVRRLKNGRRDETLPLFPSL
ncbi:helix-turn-helix domain-containing protein [Algihabitans albus]|uniref:helix-turn-helix domain-containing protein n=1 Tax=Algihabitans albus TaxID=2164067 RepID=UPI000E5D5E90|nr:helix-turn-helix domain-containing protein [Algihabitans albus]